MLEWVAIPFSRNLPNPGGEPRSPALQADSLVSEPPEKLKKKLWYIYIMQLFCCCFLVTQLYPTLCDRMNCRPPGFPIHGIFQARILEWVALSFSRGSSLLRDQICTAYLGRQILYCWATRHSVIKRNKHESVELRWMNLEPIIKSEVSQKEKNKYHILTHIYGF